MKRKIIIGLAVYTVVFLVATAFILGTIHSATSKLDNLIMLHQVEILREHYLLQIRRVQVDLALKNSRRSPDFDTLVSHARSMGSVVDTCFDCHHAGPTADRLRELKSETERYQDALSRVATIRANPARLIAEEDVAFDIGDTLIQKVSEMIAITGARLETSTQKAVAEIDHSVYVLYALVALSPLVSVALGFILVTGLTSPVGVLLQSARRLQSGDLDHRVQGLNHEFGELAGAINDMAASLKEQMHKRQRAEQLAVLGELAAGLAHEIKNPLAGIKVATEVLAGEPTLSDEDRDVVRKMGLEIVRLESLMKSFLNFAKPPKPQPVVLDVNAVLTTTLAFHGARPGAFPAGRPGIEIVKDFAVLPPVEADPMQLQQVFLNLAINAFDAMPQGGSLAVRTTLETPAGPVRVDVADTGKGIDPGQLEQIFEPFHTTKAKGTGLGLAISRQLIEQNGGTIVAEANPGGGARFTVRLPLHSPGAGAAA